MITNIETLREGLVAINDEISVVTPIHTENYQAGLIVFRPRQGEDQKWITHSDTEVISHILEGQGRLRLPDKEVLLAPGAICHIPVYTPHDFVTEGETSLTMFYMTVKVKSKKV